MSAFKPFVVPAGAWDTHVHIFDQPPPMVVGDTAYPFPDAPAAHLDAMHARLGIERAVIVDGELGGDEVLISQLAASEGRYRGVAKFKEVPTESQVARLHEAGVRGCRFYFHDMLGAPASPEFFRRVVDRIVPFGWHVLIFTFGKYLMAYEQLFRDTLVPIVLDHLCMLDLNQGVQQPALDLILDLQTTRETYVKISGGDRRSIDGEPLYLDDVPFVRRVIETNPGRVIWATDWPFVMYKKPGNLGCRPPDPLDLLTLLSRYCRSQHEVNLILRDTPNHLYGDGIGRSLPGQ